MINVDIKYTELDFQTLNTYKLFNQHVRPMIVEKNPKLAMCKMVSLIGAKWREFIELKERTQKPQHPQPNTDESNQPDDTNESSNQPIDVESETTITSLANSNKAAATTSGRGKRTTSGRKRQVDYEMDENDTNELDDDDAYVGTTSGRRSSGRAKRIAPLKIKFGASPAINNSDDAGEPKATNGAKEDKRKSNSGTAKDQATPKGQKKRRKRNDDNGEATNYNDSDAEFEAMLEEQCRIDETEIANKKKRALAKKGLNAKGQVKGGFGKIKMKDGADADGYEVGILLDKDKTTQNQAVGLNPESH
jgi:chromodomain-helicase-DNA-binding protein 4